MAIRFGTGYNDAMLLFALFLGLLGLMLSASFSGSETAFYRTPKLRIKLDAMEGDRIAHRLLRLVNNPSMFVATILVGNNVANYAVSTATVLGVGVLMPNAKGIAFEIGSTLLLAPFLFIYGEMFPKYLCLHAPNRMLRLLSPLILFFYRLFLPITALLWLLNRILAKLLGEAREMLDLTLGRQELTRVLDEGQETGILFDAQRRLADGVFDVSDRLIEEFALPRSHWPTVTTDMKPAGVLEIARKYDLIEMPVYESDTVPPVMKRRYRSAFEGAMPIGYVRTIDLEITVRNQLDEQSKQLLHLLQTELPIRSTVEIAGRHTLLTGMILLQTMQGSFACIVGEQRQCLGFIRSDQLRDILLGKTPAHAGA